MGAELKELNTDEDKTPIVEEASANAADETAKGAISDAITAEDDFEKKLAKLEPFREILWAFFDVYYAEDTPVDDFDALLTEYIGLVKALIDSDYEADDEDEKKIAGAIENGFDQEAVIRLVAGEIKPAEKAADEPAEKRFTTATVEKSEDDGTFRAIASTALVDRHGEVVSPDGWNLKNFKNNPVLLWAHDHTIPAIGVATKVWVEGKGKDAKLMFEGKWQTATEYGRAAAQLVSEGFLNSFSVGFIPFDMDGNTYTKQELLEISLVNVPANSDARILAHKSLKKSGISVDVMKDLGIDTELLDKLETMEKDMGILTNKVEALVKAQENTDTSAAPHVNPTQKSRTQQSLAKTIVSAADKALEGEKRGATSEDSVKMFKIIKRASEILIKSQKIK